VFEVENTDRKDIGYQDIYDAISKNTKGRAKVAFTIEFYPQEGKYHYTGHRRCQIRQEPEQTESQGTICPVCHKGLTVGVMHRVSQLASRSTAELKLYQDGLFTKSQSNPNRTPFISTVPLIEIFAESLNMTVNSKRVMNEYLKLTSALGGEFSVLLKEKISAIEKVSGERVARAVDKVRKGDIVVEPGYDGVFGKVKIWRNQENQADNDKEQLGLF